MRIGAKFANRLVIVLDYRIQLLHKLQLVVLVVLALLINITLLINVYVCKRAIHRGLTALTAIFVRHSREDF